MTSVMNVRTTSVLALVAAVGLLVGCGRAEPLGSVMDPTAAAPGDPAERFEGVMPGRETQEPDGSADGTDSPDDATASSEAPAAAAACPPQSGEPLEYVVRFNEWPDGIEIGQEFHCGRVRDVHGPPPPGSQTSLYGIWVQVWDEGDFLARTGADPNVAYTSHDVPDDTNCTGTECNPGGPPDSEEPTPLPSG